MMREEKESHAFSLGGGGCLQCVLDPVKTRSLLLSLDLTETYLVSLEGLESHMGKPLPTAVY